MDTNAATAKGCFLPRPATSPGFQLFAGYGMVPSRPKGWGGMVLTAHPRSPGGWVCQQAGGYGLEVGCARVPYHTPQKVRTLGRAHIGKRGPEEFFAGGKQVITLTQIQQTKQSIRPDGRHTRQKEFSGAARSTSLTLGASCRRSDRRWHGSYGGPSGAASLGP